MNLHRLRLAAVRRLLPRLYRRFLVRSDGDEADINCGWSVWHWALGWEVERHEHEATATVHAGPAIVTWWWYR